MTLKNHNFRNLLVFAAGGLGFSYLLSSLLPQQSYINISAHSVLEACGALTAIVSAIILYQRQAIENRDELKWMISGLFIMGIMDGAHCFTAPGNEFVMFHSLAVFWGGLFFAYSWIPAPKQAKENRRRFFTIIGITLAATLVTINMLSADVTAMLKNGEFTATAKLFNFVGGMGFFAGALYFFQFFSQTRDRRYFWLSLFSCFLGLSGIYFLYGEMWTGGWWLWHMLRLAAFTILMITALVAHHQSIRHLQKALARVEKGRQALQTNEDKHRSMLDAMVDPVYLCSPDLKIDYMNPAMADRIGRDATGEPCHLALHNLHKPCDWCVFEQIKGASPKDITIKSPLDNRTFQITNIPIPNPDGTVSKMTFYRDITDYLDAVSEKEQAQLQLRQAQKLEAVGTLAGGIAHDFNNILFPIIGLTEMLLEKEDDVRSQEDLQEILTAGRRAQTLVSQILAFSRKRQGSLDALDPAPIVKEVLKLARSTLPSNITIIQEIAADAGPVMADAAQLHQVVMNLISNAFHAMETSGGTLTVVLGKPADIPGHLSGRLSQWLCLSVADTGTGILPDIMDRIFDPYFTTKSQDKGSGLGLAVTHGIVELSDWVDITRTLGLDAGAALAEAVNHSVGADTQSTDDLDSQPIDPANPDIHHSEHYSEQAAEQYPA